MSRIFSPFFTNFISSNESSSSTIGNMGGTATTPPVLSHDTHSSNSTDTSLANDGNERLQYEQAESLLRAAVNADIHGNNFDAFELYQQSLDIWLDILSKTTDDMRKTQIAELISVYMSKAEDVKKRLLTPPAVRYPPALQPKKITPRIPPPTSRSVTAAPSGTSQDTKIEEHEATIMSEMLDSSPGVRWNDIIGLEYAKQTIQEVVIYPYLRPDIFRGLRAPPKGVLLYGPPGTGKTMIAKAVATESGFKFFNISSSTIMNKYLGEGEKLMKAVFSVARKHQPSVVFFDEIDSLLSARKENEHEASRRIKTEFMIQLDGAGSNPDDKILIIGATNLPWDLDEAVLRRFVRRIYIPLPDPPARESLIRSLFAKQQQTLPTDAATHHMIQRIVHITEGYSAADITALFQDAAMGPLREIPPSRLPTIRLEDIRPINEQDFIRSTQHFKPSVSQHSLEAFQKWQSSTR